MNPISLLSLALLVSSASAADLPWQDLALTIEKDHATSSDTATICRVRVVNRGGHTWPGRSVRFEALALDGGVVMARERGRFGLSISPHDSLETLIAFNGLYHRFEVRPLFRDSDGSKSKSRGGKSAKGSKKKRKTGQPG
jgi:hypothetical protein